MQNKKISPLHSSEKNAELYVRKLVQNVPTVELCWKSFHCHVQVKKVTQVKVYPNAPNATGIST